MSNGLAGRFMAPLRGSIRGQILVILLSMLFLGSLVQGVVFYLQARSVSIGQMRDSYRGLALQVSALSAYNMQFNKSGLEGNHRGHGGDRLQPPVGGVRRRFEQGPPGGRDPQRAALRPARARSSPGSS